MVKNVLLSALAAVVSALAAWIITVNVYTTAMAFRHAVAAPSQAFRLGFEVAGVVGILFFALVFYGRKHRHSSKTTTK
jgi:hypothetical protein